MPLSETAKQAGAGSIFVSPAPIEVIKHVQIICNDVCFPSLKKHGLEGGRFHVFVADLAVRVDTEQGPRACFVTLKVHSIKKCPAAAASLQIGLLYQSDLQAAAAFGKQLSHNLPEGETYPWSITLKQILVK